MSAKNSQLVIKVAVLLLFASLGSAYFGTGPYKVENIHLTLCEEQGTNEMNISVQMYRTQDRTKRILAHRGAITWPAGEYNFYMDVYRWGTDWIQLSDYGDEFCKVTARGPSFYEDISKAMGFNSTICPPPPGRRSYEEWVINIKLTLPVLPYGEYKSITKFINSKDEVMGCLVVFTDIVQKFV